MRIAIVGTRGIPNLYGGFEQCAENLGPRFVRAGHDVHVFCADYHPDKSGTWNGVQREIVSYPETKLGPLATMIYDRACIRRAVALRADVVLALGYTPASLFFKPLARAGIPVVTNMDGLEWARSKWSAPARRFIKWTEKLGVERSDALIADHPEIQRYLRERYQRESVYAAYGADHVTNYDESALAQYAVEPGRFDLAIARIEPENSVETIVRGHAEARTDVPLLVVGGVNTPLAKKLASQFERDPRIRFVGGIYEPDKLNALRRGCRHYFHGHSVGGTNPSLLEAMAAGANIWIHENPFNRYVVGPHALGFSDAADLTRKLDVPPACDEAAYKGEMQARLTDEYSWDSIAQQYLTILQAARITP